KLQADLAGTGAPVNQIPAKLNETANSVKDSLENAERKRIFFLRLISAGLGCLLVWLSGFYVFEILSKDPNASKWLTSEWLKTDLINILVGGLAAAAGSSYWHDQLDKVRSLKSATQEIKKITA
ncbi:MAG: hypothetical protein ABIN58_13895, partial [candidate division WOR-3 bacterium]